MKQENKVKEDLFKEEVPDEELYCKLGVDDHIYVSRKSGIFGAPLLIILALLLAFSALFATFYGLLSLNKDLGDRNIGVKIDEYHLKVIHSNDLYGANINSLEKYSSFDKALSYKFSIFNNNSINLDYIVKIKINNISNDLTLNMINYNLVKNGQSVKSGSLSDFDSYKVHISGKSTDEYELKIWSSNANKNSKLYFKVSVIA